MKTLILDAKVPKLLATKILKRISKAAYYAPTSPLKLAVLPDPPLPAPNWVRVRNSLCGICGSDLHQIFIDASLDVAPLALPSHQRTFLGHEMVGEIVEMGENVTDFKLGERVVRWGRGEDCLARDLTSLCPACQRGHRVLCENASEPRLHEPLGGGFSDTFITPASTLLRVPNALSDKQAILVEPAAVAIHAAMRCPINPGDHVLVYGCGVIGFLLIQAIRTVQPMSTITAIAQFPWQANLARNYGAQNVFLSNEDGYEKTSQLTEAKLYSGRLGNQMLMGGFDVIFDVVGIAETLNQSLRWARAGGSVILVGVNLHRMKLDLTPVWYQEVDLLGAIGHDVVDWQGQRLSTFELAMQWMIAGKFNLDQLVTHIYPLQEYRKAFTVAAEKEVYRSIKVAFDLRA